MLTKVSTGTQFTSPSLVSVDHRTKSARKREVANQVTVLFDYLDIDNVMDLEKLKTWCQAQWFTTFRAALMHCNRLQYHACCNCFSRRHFLRQADHPEDETFNVNKLRDFKSIETGDDFYRWQLNLAKENKKNGLKTPFPSINSKHCHGDNDTYLGKEDQENKGLLRKRLLDLEQEVEEKKKLINYVQTENARLLRSSKAWHLKYEELLETYYPPNDLLATPVKRNVSNWMISEDN